MSKTMAKDNSIRVLSNQELKGNAGMFPVCVRPPDEILQGIGNVLTAFAFLEWRVSVALCYLLDIDLPEGRITFEQGPTATLKKIKSLFEFNGTPSPVSFKAMVKPLEAATLVRNQLAHGLWLSQDGKINLQTTRSFTDFDQVRLRHEFTPVTIDVSGDYFERKRNDIFQLVEQIEKIVAVAAHIQARRRAAIIAENTAAAHAPDAQSAGS